MSKNQEECPPSPDELFFGIVRAVGTDATKVIGELTGLLHKAGYHVAEIPLGSFLPGTRPMFDKSQYYKNQIKRMEEGDNARIERPDALALRAVREIGKLRKKANRANWIKTSRYAYILDPIVHPSEVLSLRTIYGRHFFLLSLYEDESDRYGRLHSLIEQSAEKNKSSTSQLVIDIMERDRGKGAKSNGIAIGKTFHLGDVFIDVKDPVRHFPPWSRPDEERDIGLTTSTLNRFFDQVFSGSRHSPSKHEIAMSYAYSAQLRSNNLARSVGAAIVTPDGTLLATGYNEVPAPGGGQYPVQRDDGVVLDVRDHSFTPRIDRFHGQLDDQFGYDANDLIKYEIFEDLIERLNRIGAIGEGLSLDAKRLIFRDQNATDDPDRVSDSQRRDLLQAEVFDVIEYSRSVHAEMSALMSALRHGVSVRGCHLYSTTFPCHECARHIIAAGIDRVVYVEPYPKSRISVLHRDAIVLGQRSPTEDAGDRRPVEFIPFIGITLARQSELFSQVKRKVQFGDEYPPGKALASKKLEWEGALDAKLRWLQEETVKGHVASAQRQVAEKIALAELKEIGYFRRNKSSKMQDDEH